MSTLLGDARVRIRPDARGFESETRRSVLGPLKGIAIAAAGVFAAAGIGSALKGAIDEASDLGESINALNVTYGEASEGVQRLGKAAATSLGLSNTEFNSLAVRFSAFAKTIAGDGGDVVGTLDDLTTRASDFASVMNLEVADAAQLFQSGLAGEAEPLRAFGIDLSAASVEAYALANGISDSAGSMTEAEKVQARYGSIMEQTAQTTGDFANTSDELANSKRILAARVDDLQAKFGAALLPAMQAVVGYGLDNVVPWLESTVDWFVGLDDAIGDVSVDGLVTKLDELTGIDLSGVPDAITGAFDNITADIDFSGLFTGIKDDAADAAGDILAGFKTGMETGDWSGFGEALGNGIVVAIEAIPDIGGAIYGVASRAIAEVDWGKLALDFGKIAPTIGLGFITGLLNFDIGALFKFVGDNWFEVLLGVVTILFAPAKLIGAIGKVLAKIPFVGTFLEKALLAFNSFGREKILPFITRFLGNIALGFKAGGTTTIGRAVGGVLSTVYLRFLYFKDRAVAFFAGLPGALAAWVDDLGIKIGIGIRLLTSNFGTLVGRLWSGAQRLFAEGVRWLILKVDELFPGVTRVLARLIIEGPAKAKALFESVKAAFRTGVAAVTTIFLGLVSTILSGAAEAFDWVPGIGDKLATASAAFDEFKNNVNASIGGITAERNISIRAELNATADALVKAGADPAAAAKRVRNIGLATGGAVRGPGTSTSDSIPAMLSNDEHVWTAREVHAAGGHDAVKMMRRQVLRRANGGEVTRNGVTVTPHLDNTDDLDAVVTRLNAGSKALGDSMSGYVKGLEGAAKQAASAMTTAGALGPIPRGDGWVRPIKGGIVTSEYGPRGGRMHSGIDVSTGGGAAIYAARAGRVKARKYHSSWGNHVQVQHDLGMTNYAHMVRAGVVSPGQLVKAGQLLGYEGNTGNSFGAHLHFEWSPNGSGRVNPRRLGLFDKGGLAYGVGAMMKDVIAPERTLDPRQTVAFEKWMDRGAPAAPTGGTTTHVHVYIDGQEFDARARVVVDEALTAGARTGARTARRGA